MSEDMQPTRPSRKKPSWLGRLFAGSAIALSLGLGVAALPAVTPAASPSSPAIVQAVAPQEASASLINLKVRNVGKKKLKVCGNWPYPSGQWTSKVCPKPSKWLKQYQWSHHNPDKIKDVDAVWVEYKYRLKEKVVTWRGPNGQPHYAYITLTTCTHRAPYALKVQPKVSDSDRELYLAKCTPGTK